MIPSLQTSRLCSNDDPHVKRHMKTIKSVDQLSPQYIDQQLKQELEEGRLHIFQGGRPGGVSFLVPERVNSKFYDHVVFESGSEGDYMGL